MKEENHPIPSPKRSKKRKREEIKQETSEKLSCPNLEVQIALLEKIYRKPQLIGLLRQEEKDTLKGCSTYSTRDNSQVFEKLLNGEVLSSNEEKKSLKASIDRRKHNLISQKGREKKNVWFGRKK